MSSPISRRTFLKLLPLVPALAAAPHLLPLARGASPAQTQPNVLILVFDTVSAENMSLYGYPRATTPNLSRFAEKAIVYHAHYAAGNFTSPGTSSLLTGTYPWSHRGFGFQGTVAANFEDKNIFKPFAAAGYHRLAYTHNWLAVTLLNQFRKDLNVFKPMRDLSLVDEESSDRLFANDYNIAFSSERLLVRRSAIGTSSLFFSLLDRIRRSQDLKALKEEYGKLFPRGIPNLENVYFVLEEVIDWLQTELTNSPRPFVKYIHLLPPHEPYNTRREFIDRFKDNFRPVVKKQHFFGCCMDQKFLNLMRRQYDEYLAYADAEFGRLYDFMARTNILDSTYVIFTSDHGQMMEREIHGHVTPVLFDPIIRVPLIISSPGQTRREDVYTQTSCVDLLPTLARLIGQKAPDWSEGEVLPPFEGSQPRRGRGIFSVEAKSNPKQAPLTKATFALIRDENKLIHYVGYDGFEDRYEFFNLKDDPEELNNLYGSKRSLAGELQTVLAQKVREVNQTYQHG